MLLPFGVRVAHPPNCHSPVLTAGLVELDLRHCAVLHLTDAEVDGLLHRCPELHTVRLERSAAAGEDAGAALAAALERRRTWQEEGTNAV